MVGTVVCLADWVSTEDLGFLGRIGTDPNSVVPMSLLSGPVISLSPRRCLPRTGALTLRAPFPVRP